jgi:hypothetical protein
LVKFSIFTKKPEPLETPEFLKVLQHFPATSSKEAESVLTLKENFPFSQVLHILSARVSKDHEFANSKTVLHLAAVYSADRGVLKEIMEASRRPVGANGMDQPAGPVTVGSDMANVVLEDLEKLSKLRQKFELLFAEGPTSSQFALSAIVETEVPVQEESETITLTKKERIVQLAKTMSSPLEERVLEVEPGFKTRRRKKDVTDTLLDQIAVTKQELTPESEKHKEQIEIIDHFIKIQPSITGSKDKQAQSNDLATIKTGEFGDHIISETLVEILLKQGKKEKAVEVLKKLIWKFPQKKAYFAAQIEELRK